MAKVNKNNINYFNTYYKSIYFLKEEHEIELLHNSTIELYAIKIKNIKSIIHNNLYNKEVKLIKNLFGEDKFIDIDMDLYKNISEESNKLSTLYFKTPITILT